MPNTYACKGVSNPNVPIFPPRVCTLVLFIFKVLIYLGAVSCGYGTSARICIPCG